MKCVVFPGCDLTVVIDGSTVVFSLVSKIKEGGVSIATSGDVFNSSTLGGAHVLRRTDLGRIAPGAKAEIVLVNLRTMGMSPVRDPLEIS